MSKDLFYYLRRMAEHLRDYGVDYGEEMRIYLLLFRDGWWARDQAEWLEKEAVEKEKAK